MHAVFYHLRYNLLSCDGRPVVGISVIESGAGGKLDEEILSIFYALPKVIRPVLTWRYDVNASRGSVRVLPSLLGGSGDRVS